MSELACHIDSLRFDIAATSVASARALQQRLSAFARGPLQQVLEAVLAQAGRGGVLSFERIELDLGELDDSRLERQLGERLARALADYLQRHGVLCQGGGGMVAGPQAQPDGIPDLQELAAFFNGAGTAAAGAALAAAALRQRPDQLLRMVRAEGRKQAVRQRLALALPQPLIAQLIALLEPGEAPLIVAYVATVCQLHRERALVPESRHHLRAVLWEFVLAYLLLERGSYFNSKALVGHTLHQLARRYRTSYAQLLEQLGACMLQPGLPTAHGHALAAILGDLRRAMPAAPGLLAPAFSERSLLSDQLAALAGFFEHGVLPATAAAAGLGALLDSVAGASPGHLQALLMRIGRQPRVRQRLAFQLSEAQVRQVLAALEPEHGPWIAATVGSIVQVQSRQAVLREDPWRLRRQLWELVFCVLLDERGSWFNTRAFIKSLLLKMAARYRVAYRVLLQELIGLGLGLVPLAATRRQRGLPAILLSLRHDCRDEADTDLQRLAPPAAARAARKLLLRHTLAGANLTRATLLQAARRGGVSERTMLAALLAPHNALAPLLAQRDAVQAMLADLGADLGAGLAAGATSPASAAPPRFARAAREFTLRSLRLERGSYFNNRSFIKSMLEQLSARHAIAYDQLLRGLIAQSGAASTALAPTTLPAILLSLKRDGAPAPSDPRLSFPAPGDTDAALYFLEFGVVPGGSDLAALRQQGYGGHDGAALVRVLRASRQRDGALERLLRYATPAQLGVVLRALAPDFAPFAETCVLAFLASGQQASVAGTWPRVRADLAALAWRAILRSVLGAAGGALAPAALAAAFCAALAPRLGLDAATFRARLLARARAGGHPRFEALAGVLAPAGAARSPVAAPFTPAPAPAPVAVAVDALELWSALLRHGLPAALARAPSLSAAGLMTALAQALRREPARCSAMLARAAGGALERHRIANLLPTPLRRQVVATLLGAHAPGVTWWRGALARALPAPVAGAGWRAMFDEELLRAVARHGAGRFSLERFVADLLTLLQRRRQISALAVLGALGKDAGATPAARALIATLARRPALSAAAAAQPVGAAVPVPEELPLQQRFAIDNAGLVILWPFLDRYFSLLGLQQDGVFAGERARWRAVYLLHYLSHGSVEAPEHALLLNKILCGVDSAAPLEPGGPLTDQEHDVSQQILGAVTQNWSKLNNTDAEGLRSAFLRRAAYLVRAEHHWDLQVERGALDVLMPSLPWTLGTIKLSWMERIVKVSW